MWSPWKCEMMTVSTALRSMPAAVRLLWNWPTDALAPLEVGRARAGVDDDELGAGVDDDRRVRDRHQVLLHVRGVERLLELVFRDVEDERVGSLRCAGRR